MTVEGNLDYETLFEGKNSLVPSFCVRSFKRVSIRDVHDGPGPGPGGTGTKFFSWPGPGLNFFDRAWDLHFFIGGDNFYDRLKLALVCL